MQSRLNKVIFSIIMNLARHAKWLMKNSRFARLDAITAHLLIVKNPIYATLAKTCIESFLYFHPNAKIIIHYDSQTLNAIKSKFRLLKIFRRRSLYFQETLENASWQYSKLNLILSLQGTNHFFMDCDLRWNGVIQDHPNKSMLYFVKEKPLDSYPGILPYLPQSFHNYGKALMKNTSLFSWSEFEINNEFRNEVERIWWDLFDLCHNSSNKDLMSILRVSEQLVLSIIPEKLEFPYSFLKEVDAQFDGSVCESSYYGASYGKFAFWGNTNRKSLFRRL